MIMGFSVRLQLLLLSGAGAVFCFFLEVLFGVLGVLLLGVVLCLGWSLERWAVGLLGLCWSTGAVGLLGLCSSTGAVLVYWGNWSTGAVLVGLLVY